MYATSSIIGSSFAIYLFCFVLVLKFVVCNCEGLPLSDARDMVKEEVNCIGGKCPEGKKHCNCLPPVVPIMDNYETNASCRRDNECIKYCPKGCKIVNCNFGTCFCEC